MTWKSYYPHTHTHINLNHQPPPLTLPLFPGVCETTKSFGELPESFWLLNWTTGWWMCILCYHLNACVHVLRGHAGAAGWSPQSQKKRARETENERERGREEWEGPPLAVPLGWFELGTPAGIQVCTSCRGGGRFSLCVWRKDERNGVGGAEWERRRPAACRQLPIRLLGLSRQWSPDALKEKKNPLPPTLFLCDLAEFPPAPLGACPSVKL